MNATTVIVVFITRLKDFFPLFVFVSWQQLCLYPTERLTILELKNHLIRKFYEVRKRQSMGFAALKLSNVRSGRGECTHQKDVWAGGLKEWQTN